jgi:hypothetical protein
MPQQFNNNPATIKAREAASQREEDQAKEVLRGRGIVVPDNGTTGSDSQSSIPSRASAFSNALSRVSGGDSSLTQTSQKFAPIPVNSAMNDLDDYAKRMGIAAQTSRQMNADDLAFNIDKANKFNPIVMGQQQTQAKALQNITDTSAERNFGDIQAPSMAMQGMNQAGQEMTSPLSTFLQRGTSVKLNPVSLGG